MKILFLTLFIFGHNAFGLPFSTSKELDWWQTSVFYQIYPKSFMDSNGDGIGDLKGITSKLEHLKEAGVQATWLSPIMKSPQLDGGYDISDFKAIDQMFGTMEDYEEMVAKANELGIKVIMDFVPNHSSNDHEWFKKSEKREAGYEDYYMWNDGKLDDTGSRIPPNNWVSVFYGSAWTWSDTRQQYYFHQFDKSQPDLNYRNPRVVEEMKDVLRFWLKKGASGFRVDAINHLFEVDDLRDEPLTGWTQDPNDYGYVHHDYTKDLLDTYEMIREWRQLLDDWTNEKQTETKILMTEAYANQTFTTMYYEYGSHFPFNFGFIENLNDRDNAYGIRQVVDNWLNNMPKGAAANWVLGNHDKPRVGSRFGFERHDGMLAIELTLPGVAVTYNGEEIGMLDHRDISWEDTQDPQACNNEQEGYQQRSRDPQRTPFQWDSTKNSGFSNATHTWLPLHPNYQNNNLAKQNEASKSYFSFYKDLTSLRKNPAFQLGSIRTYIFEDMIYSHVRELEDEKYIVIVNLSFVWRIIDVNRALDVDDQVEVVVAGHRSSYKKGDVLDALNLQVRSYDALVLRAK